MKNICGPSSDEWNRMSNEEKKDFKQSFEDINKFAEKVVKEDELLKNIDSKKLFQELIDRKFLIPVPKYLNSKFIVKKTYQQKGTIYKGIFLSKE